MQRTTKFCEEVKGEFDLGIVCTPGTMVSEQPQYSTIMPAEDHAVHVSVSEHSVANQPDCVEKDVLKGLVPSSQGGSEMSVRSDSGNAQNEAGGKVGHTTGPPPTDPVLGLLGVPPTRGPPPEVEEWVFDALCDPWVTNPDVLLKAVNSTRTMPRVESAHEQYTRWMEEVGSVLPKIERAGSQFQRNVCKCQS